MMCAERENSFCIKQNTAAWSFSLPGAPVDCGDAVALPEEK